MTIAKTGGLRFEPWISKIQNRNTNQSTQDLVHLIMIISLTDILPELIVFTV